MCIPLVVVVVAVVVGRERETGYKLQKWLQQSRMSPTHEIKTYLVFIIMKSFPLRIFTLLQCRMYPQRRLS